MNATTQALHQYVVFWERPELQVIEISGNDRLDFLQRILSNDVKKLRPGEGQESMLLTHTGKISIHFRLFAKKDLLQLVGEKDWIPKILAQLEKFRFAEKVNFCLKEEIHFLSVQGPQSRQRLESLWKHPMPREIESYQEIEFDGKTLFVSHTRDCEEEGFWLGVDSSGYTNLVQTLSSTGIVPADALTMEAARIEAGIPKLGVELDETVYPPQANLERGYSLNKGCYTGQEVLARMRTYGGVPKKLVGIVFKEANSLVTPCAIRVNDQEIGSLRSFCVSPRSGKGIGLGYVLSAHALANAEVSVESNSGLIVPLQPQSHGFWIESQAKVSE